MSAASGRCRAIIATGLPASVHHAGERHPSGGVRVEEGEQVALHEHAGGRHEV